MTDFCSFGSTAGMSVTTRVQKSKGVQKNKRLYRETNQEFKSAAHLKSVHAIEQNSKNKICVTYNEFASIFGQVGPPDCWRLTGDESRFIITGFITIDDITCHTSHVYEPDGIYVT
jgi:hypothetical protein